MQLQATASRLRSRLAAAWARARGKQPWAATVAAAAALLLLLIVARPRIVAPTLRRWRPEIRHPLRVMFPFQDKALAQAKAALPRYQLPPDVPFPHFPVHVIALERAGRRRAAAQEQLASRGVNFTFFDAVDGAQQPLPDADVQWYTSGARWRGVSREPAGGRWHRKIAADLSHYRLMHRLLAGDDEMQLVLESDFHLLYGGAEWLQRLQAVMEQLPADWEVLWLNHGKGARSAGLPFVGRGVRLHLDNTITVSYMYRRSFALKMLHDANLADKDIDNLVNDLGTLGIAAAYVADPPLVGLGSLAAQSIIEQGLDPFGSKADAVQLLQEWVGGIGSEAGLNPSNTSLSTGSIGAPESTLELECHFDSLAELEGFWSAIPQQQHKAWGQRMQQYIVHGSPQWHVYRCLPAFPDSAPSAAGGSAAALGGLSSGQPRGRPAAAGAASSSSASSSSGGSSLVIPSNDELSKYAEAADGAAPLPSTKQQTASGLSIVSGDEEAQTVLDWKGDPMQIRPGDRLPGVKFL